MEEEIYNSLMNNLSEEELDILNEEDTIFIRKVFHIVSKLDDMCYNTLVKDKAIVDKIINLLEIELPAERLPKHISKHGNGKSYVARRQVGKKRVLVKQSIDLNIVIEALKKFNLKHNLK